MAPKLKTFFDDSLLIITEKSTLILFQTGRAISNHSKKLSYTQLNVYCTTKGQIISEQKCSVLNFPKMNEIIARISALVSKMGKIKKIEANHYIKWYIITSVTSVVEFCGRDLTGA